VIGTHPQEVDEIPAEEVPMPEDDKSGDDLFVRHETGLRLQDVGEVVRSVGVGLAKLFMHLDECGQVGGRRSPHGN